jgi:hypothetical protein
MTLTDASVGPTHRGLTHRASEILATFGKVENRAFVAE